MATPTETLSTLRHDFLACERRWRGVLYNLDELDPFILETLYPSCCENLRELQTVDPSLQAVASHYGEADVWPAYERALAMMRALEQGMWCRAVVSDLGVADPVV